MALRLCECFVLIVCCSASVAATERVVWTAHGRVVSRAQCDARPFQRQPAVLPGAG